MLKPRLPVSLQRALDLSEQLANVLKEMRPRDLEDRDHIEHAREFVSTARCALDSIVDRYGVEAEHAA